MAFNGVIGANCIYKIYYNRLLENLVEGAEKDIQLSVFLDVLERLPDCSDIAEEPLEPGKRLDKEGKIIEIPKMPKRPRKLSAYQEHMSKCAKKENGKNFPLCVQEWNRLKERNLESFSQTQ